MTITSFQPIEEFANYAKTKGKEVNGLQHSFPIYKGVYFNIYLRDKESILLKDVHDSEAVMIRCLEDAEILRDQLEIYIKKVKEDAM